MKVTFTDLPQPIQEFHKGALDSITRIRLLKTSKGTTYTISVGKNITQRFIFTWKLEDSEWKHTKLLVKFFDRGFQR
jgi:hypothetical protein